MEGMPMPAAAACATSRTATYRRRQPERSLLYRTVQMHLATWLELAQDESGRSAPAHVEREFRRYLECGILAHGFARARCADCGHDYLIAFSCKGRGDCPSCNTRRMVETAAQLADHVLPRLPVRQSVLSVPKRLRYFLQTAPAVQNLALHIFSRRWNGGCAPPARRAATRPAAVRSPLSTALALCSIHMCISTAWWSMACSRPPPKHANLCVFTKRQH